MASAMMVDRGGLGLAGMGSPAAGPMGNTGTMPGAPAMMMVPRCTLKMEKCTGGMKITCTCDDKMSCSMLQNLCTMLSGGLCTCCVMMNGMVVCCCNLTMGLCKCEMTDSGVCLTCTSGDKDCCAMIQACCDCVASMVKAGCSCCVCLNNMPVCCG
jgi:hypothetical protein